MGVSQKIRILTSGISIKYIVIYMITAAENNKNRLNFSTIWQQKRAINKVKLSGFINIFKFYIFLQLYIWGFVALTDILKKFSIIIPSNQS